ncbi:MAG: 16S rRNA (cytosine(1402)-N(4))-methyltransferase RsmH [Candidatus Gracilibacteria bacterium]|jgi:16S rRNA (cytosine1402-N4)-methyltransferase
MIKKKSKLIPKNKAQAPKKNKSTFSKLKEMLFSKKAQQKKVIAKPIKKVQPKVKVQPKAKAQPKLQKKAKAKVQPKIKAKPLAKANVKKVQPKVKVQSKAKTKPLIKAKAKVQAKKIQVKKAKKVILKKVKVLKIAKVLKPKVEIEIPALPTQLVESVQPMHDPVLLREVLEGLQLPGKKVIVDGTLGLGGHAHALLTNANGDSKLVAFELDEENLKRAQEKLKEFDSRIHYIQSNFRNLAEELKKLKIHGVDAILLDLGLSSPQVDVAERGFSFLREGPLDMRFDKNQELTAAHVINSYPEKELARIFYEYGEEMKSRLLAREIVRRRRSRSFKTTTELAGFIEKYIKRQGHIHPATRVFQALRIEVNKELESLQSVMEQAMGLLKKKGRLAIIAYHSLEDRLVKNFFKDQARDYINLPDQLTTTHLDPKLKIVTKKPLTPGETELTKNPRSRSAKLRVAEKI